MRRRRRRGDIAVPQGVDLRLRARLRDGERLGLGERIRHQQRVHDAGHVPEAVAERRDLPVDHAHGVVFQNEHVGGLGVAMDDVRIAPVGAGLRQRGDGVGALQHGGDDRLRRRRPRHVGRLRRAEGEHQGDAGAEQAARAFLAQHLRGRSVQCAEGATDIADEPRSNGRARHLLRHQRVGGRDQLDGEHLVGLVIVIIFGHPRREHREHRIVDREPEDRGLGPHRRGVRRVGVARLLDDVTGRAGALDPHQMIASDIFRRGDGLRHDVVGREQTQAQQMLQGVAAGQHGGPPRLGAGAPTAQEPASGPPLKLLTG